MKKFKALLFSSVPLLFGIGIQIVAQYYLLFIAAIFLFIIAPIIQGNSYTTEDLLALSTNADFSAILGITFSVCCVAFFGIWYYASCSGNYKVNIKKTFHQCEILGIILLIPGTQFLSTIITSLISVAFPSWLEDYMALIESSGLSGNVPLLMLIYSVCLAPISEELLFRGVTYRIARRAFPFWIANIIQAFLFGLFHMNMIQGCYTFVLGLILGYVCEKGGSIYHVIFFHFLFNLWGTTAMEWFVIDDELLQGLIVILGAILCMTFGLLLFNKGNRMKLEKAAQ